MGVEQDTTMRNDLREQSEPSEFESQAVGNESTYRSVAALAALGEVPSGLILSALTVIVLLFTGWMGGSMVFRHHVGVMN